ncbi:unnamed protein product [Penicillium nalgiovense]|uniref:Alpha/beta hydrolase fold-3 domain-containing protein n=1 Tax=Penicillium nalgiovense TaxID=60175 RepID=A0A9W4MQ88_PENNA|nr:unnamed protein product [Penicillium nalgiovense]CAG7968918.1 unnamed protein product [Penicillium nalgiovense]CAG7981617.1 unnamed protein product [Penicillium nalgiovense]CAG7992064.1 unnamed protein product [Penicillium nalgiovense]CAG7997209.1 unnamed protein product [Penicillium nalgiovense]
MNQQEKIKFAGQLRQVASKQYPEYSPRPDAILHIPSRAEERSICVHKYEPSQKSSPGPVLINFHGSGFIMRLHGSDEEFARQVASNTDYTVLDCAYRLAPEDPWPAAVDDVEDVVKWVLSRPTEFLPSRISISGFSAGGNLALVASSTLFPRQFEKVLAVYPAVNLFQDGASKAAPDPNGEPIPTWMTDIFTDCYVGQNNKKDPRISPFFSAPESFPDKCCFVTCARDNLCPEAEDLAMQIKSAPGKLVYHRRMDECGHAFDKTYKLGSTEEKVKDAAYSFLISFLNNE